MLVRERAEADLAACAQLARDVPGQDGYPHYLCLAQQALAAARATGRPALSWVPSRP